MGKGKPCKENYNKWLLGTIYYNSLHQKCPVNERWFFSPAEFENPK